MEFRLTYPFVYCCSCFLQIASRPLPAFAPLSLFPLPRPPSSATVKMIDEKNKADHHSHKRKRSGDNDDSGLTLLAGAQRENKEEEAHEVEEGIHQAGSRVLRSQDDAREFSHRSKRPRREEDNQESVSAPPRSQHPQLRVHHPQRDSSFTPLSSSSVTPSLSFPIHCEIAPDLSFIRVRIPRRLLLPPRSTTTIDVTPAAEEVEGRQASSQQQQPRMSFDPSTFAHDSSLQPRHAPAPVILTSQCTLGEGILRSLQKQLQLIAAGYATINWNTTSSSSGSSSSYFPLPASPAISDSAVASSAPTASVMDDALSVQTTSSEMMVDS